VEGTGIEGKSKEVEGMKGMGVKGEGERTERTKKKEKRKGKSGEVYNAASKSSIDESRFREGGYL